jgi:hypothetical protein
MEHDGPSPDGRDGVGTRPRISSRAPAGTPPIALHPCRCPTVSDPTRSDDSPAGDGFPAALVRLARGIEARAGEGEGAPPEARWAVETVDAAAQVVLLHVAARSVPSTPDLLLARAPDGEAVRAVTFLSFCAFALASHLRRAGAALDARAAVLGTAATLLRGYGEPRFVRITADAQAMLRAVAALPEPEVMQHWLQAVADVVAGAVESGDADGLAPLEKLYGILGELLPSPSAEV